MDNGVDTIKKGTGWIADTTGDVAGKVAEGGKGLIGSITGLFGSKEE